MQGDCSPSEPKPLGDILWMGEGVTGRQGGPPRGGCGAQTGSEGEHVCGGGRHAWVTGECPSLRGGSSPVLLLV